MTAPLALGHDTATGRPVELDPSAGPVVLLTGSTAAGKTAALHRLGQEAARAGSLVVNVAPHDLSFDGEGVIDLTDPEALPGALDPLRVALPPLREQVTAAFLLALLRPAPAEWEHEITRAVHDAAHDRDGDLSTVLDRLRAARLPAMREAGAALAVEADHGLARLAFPARAQRSNGLARLWRRSGARRLADPPLVREVRDHTLDRPVTTIRLDLHPPDYRRPAAQHTLDERASAATMLLVAAYALRLAATTQRHKLLIFDTPASAIINFTRGRVVFDRLARLARSYNSTIALAVRRPEPAAGLAAVIGTHLAFRQAGPNGARQAIHLLDLDPDGPWTGRLGGYRAGHCLMRDLDGEIIEIRVADGDRPHPSPVT